MAAVGMVLNRVKERSLLVVASSLPSQTPRETLTKILPRYSLSESSSNLERELSPESRMLASLKRKPYECDNRRTESSSCHPTNVIVSRTSGCSRDGRGSYGSVPLGTALTCWQTAHGFEPAPCTKPPAYTPQVTWTAEQPIKSKPAGSLTTML